jgi:hypothetical protein
MKPSIYDAISVEPLYRYDHNAGDRRYARVDERGKVIWYPSVTTIIRATSPTPPGLLGWYAKHGIDAANELRDEAAERGTEMHLNFERYLQGHNVELAMLTDFQSKALLSFDQFCRDYKVEPLGIEVMLWNDDLCYAGACDLIAWLTDPKTGQRDLSIIDFKSGSSSYEDHAVQTEMYRQAWNEMALQRPEYQVERHYNWHPKDWRRSPTYNLKDNTFVVDPEVPRLRSELYKLTNERKPKSKFLFRGTLPGDGHYVEIDPDQVILEAYANTQSRIFDNSAAMQSRPSAPPTTAPFESTSPGV